MKKILVIISILFSITLLHSENNISDICHITQELYDNCANKPNLDKEICFIKKIRIKALTINYNKKKDVMIINDIADTCYKACMNPRKWKELRDFYLNKCIGDSKKWKKH